MRVRDRRRRVFHWRRFAALAIEVVESGGVEEILQLGSPYGYRPLRRYLLAQSQQAGEARADDDVLITNGCQQALDLLARSLGNSGEATVIVEDPVYHGLIRVFEGSGCLLTPVADGSGRYRNGRCWKKPWRGRGRGL